MYLLLLHPLLVDPDPIGTAFRTRPQDPAGGTQPSTPPPAPPSPTRQQSLLQSSRQRPLQRHHPSEQQNNQQHSKQQQPTEQQQQQQNVSALSAGDTPQRRSQSQSQYQTRLQHQEGPDRTRNPKHQPLKASYPYHSWGAQWSRILRRRTSASPGDPAHDTAVYCSASDAVGRLADAQMSRLGPTPHPTPRINFPISVYSHRGGSLDCTGAAHIETHGGTWRREEQDVTKPRARFLACRRNTSGGGARPVDGSDVVRTHARINAAEAPLSPRIAAAARAPRPEHPHVRCSCYACVHGLPLIENTLTVRFAR